MHFRLPIAIAVLLLAPLFSVSAAEWQPPAIQFPANRQHPVVALPPGGLELLRDAHKRNTPVSAEVKKMVAAGEKAIAAKLEFPPRGGHHNQWYQCDACQRPLKTVNSGHQCPTCKKIYKGEPYDDVVFSRQHSANLRRMNEAAWAYAITEDEKFARFARDVLVGYGERYLAYPRRHASRRDTSSARRSGGHIYDQTLTEAYHLQDEIAESYDLIHNSPSLSAADHKKIREGLILPMLHSIAGHSAGKGNWQTFHNTAMFWAGAVLGDIEWMKRSILDPENGFVFQMNTSVTPDGLWYEGTWSYHFYSLTGLSRHAVGAAHMGINLWGNPSLRKMFVLPVAYEMSDGTTPRFGDATTLRPAERWSRLGAFTEPAYSYYKDDSLLPILPPKLSLYSYLYGNENVDRLQKKVGQTVVLPDTGHAILRTAGPGKLSAAFTFAPHGGSHGHFDKMSFVLFGFEEELAVDRGRASSQAYRLPIHREWYRATISHNTVLVDGKDQKPGPAELLFHQSNADFAAVVARNNDAHPGVEHRRMLFLTPGYLLVFDDLKSDKERQFDWFYHNRGENPQSANLRLQTANPPKYAPGFAYIENSVSAETRQPVQATFPGKNVHVQLLAAGLPGTTFTTGDGPGASAGERVPLLFLSRKAPETKFAAVIEPHPANKKPSVSSVVWEESARGIEITVQREGGADHFLLTPEHRASIRFSPTQ